MQKMAIADLTYDHYLMVHEKFSALEGAKRFEIVVKSYSKFEDSNLKTDDWYMIVKVYGNTMTPSRRDLINDTIDIELALHDLYPGLPVLSEIIHEE